MTSIPQTTSPANGSAGATRSPESQPVEPRRCRRRIRAGRRGAANARSRPRRPLPGLGASARSRSAHDILDKVGNEILARKDELGRLLAREEGKTLPEGIGEAVRAGHIFKFFAGEALRIAGREARRRCAPASMSRSRASRSASSASSRRGISRSRSPPGRSRRRSPTATPSCSSRRTWCPAARWALAEIIARAGLPAGRLQSGHGPRLGRRRDARSIIPDVAAITSPARSRPAARSRPQAVARMAKFQLEMGGKNPLVVLDDADLETAVECRRATARSSPPASAARRRRGSSSPQGIHDRFVDAHDGAHEGVSSSTTR